MPNNNELQIILSLVDEASDKLKAIASETNTSTEKIKSSFEKASRASIQFSDQMKMLGKTISMAGMTMTFFGTGITAPFILALKNSAQNSTALAMKIDNLKAVFQDFQLKMATAVIPIVDRFSNVVANLNIFLNSLSPAMVNTVMQTTMMVGIFLTFGGILTAVVGKVITLIANLNKLLAIFMGFAAANAPLLLIAGSIAVIIALMFKFQVVANVVMNTFQILFLSLKIGFDLIVITVNGAILGIMQTIDWLMQQLGKLPGFLGGGIARDISQSLQPAIRELAMSVDNARNDIQNSVNAIGDIFRTGTGTWAESFDKFKIKIDEVKDKILGLGTNTAKTTQTSNALWKQQQMGVQNALSAMSAALTQAAAQNKSFAIAAKVVAIGLAIVNTAVGVTNALAVPPPWLGMALAAIIAAAGAIQIATISSQKFAEGGRPSLGIPSLVGERGPELFVPDTAGTIIPNNRIGGSIQNIAIEINYPVIRSDDDIDKLTEEISYRLARDSER